MADQPPAQAAEADFEAATREANRLEDEYPKLIQSDETTHNLARAYLAMARQKEAAERKAKIWEEAVGASTAVITASRAQARAAVEALRRHAVSVGRHTGQCNECRTMWPISSDERHADGCLAAPSKEKDDGN